MKKIELLVFGAFLIFGTFALVSSATIPWNFDKNQTCQIFNYSGQVCDSFWCSQVLNGTWTTDQLCLFNATIVVNQTTQTNQTNQTGDSFNASLYISRSDFFNLTGYTPEELQNQTLKQQLISQKLSLLGTVDNLSNQVNTINWTPIQPQPQGMDGWMLMVIILAILAVGVYFGNMAWQSRHKEETSKGFKREFDNYGDQGNYIPKRPIPQRPRREVTPAKPKYERENIGNFQGEGDPQIEELEDDFTDQQGNTGKPSSHSNFGESLE